MILVSRIFYYLASIPTLFLGVKNRLTMLRVFAGQTRRAPTLIELRNGLRFQIRTPMDVWVLKEAVLERQYERASVAIQDGWTIIDIGAGIGDFAIGVAHAHPRANVFAFEPFPESFALLQENLRLNSISNVKAFPLAIGNTSGTMQLTLATPEPVQHRTVGTTTNTTTGITVTSTTLDQVFAEHKLAACDYLKMDCEGAEYEIFFGMNPATLKKIRHICLEHHNGVTQYSHVDLIRFFEQNGFRAKRIPNPAHSDLGLVYAENKTPGFSEKPGS